MENKCISNEHPRLSKSTPVYWPNLHDTFMYFAPISKDYRKESYDK